MGGTGSQAARQRSRRGEGDQLREALLDAATALLGEVRDVERLSVRAVTGRAGVSPTALYLHFADKAALTLAVKDHGFGTLREHLVDAQAHATADPIAALIAMGDAYLAFAREQPALYAVLFMTHIPRRGAPVERDADGRGPGERVFFTVAQAVGRAMAAAEGRAPDERRVFEGATVVWMALHGRASVERAMPTFPFPGEHDFMTLLAARFGAAPPEPSGAQPPRPVCDDPDAPETT